MKIKIKQGIEKKYFIQKENLQRSQEFIREKKRLTSQMRDSLKQDRSVLLSRVTQKLRQSFDYLDDGSQLSKWNSFNKSKIRSSF